jgi:hypothetical protein
MSDFSRKGAEICFHAKAQSAQRKPKSFLNLASFAAWREIDKL